MTSRFESQFKEKYIHIESEVDTVLDYCLPESVVLELSRNCCKRLAILIARLGVTGDSLILWMNDRKWCLMSYPG